MKKGVCITGIMSAMLMLVLGEERALALSPETTLLLDLLKAKGIITQSEAETFAKTLEEKIAAPAPIDDGHYHSVKSLADRIDNLEGKGEGKEVFGSKVSLSGLVEAEMATSRAKEADGATTNNSDIALATAQLNVDAEVNQYVNGRLVFLYEEEEDNDTIVIDEAVVSLKGGDNSPLYANVGRQYIPFGRFESHFISDPGTLTLGETNDTAVVAGYANDIINVNVGGFNGKVKEADTGDHVNTVLASVTLTRPKVSEDGFSLEGGLSYLSNLATSDGLEDKTTGGEVVNTIGGWSSFISVAFADRFFVDAEYLGAVNDFAVGDLDFADADNLRPEAWNLEAATRLCQNAEFALRYGGSEGGGTFLPRDEYGAALLYTIFDSTNLTIEYLYQEFLGGGDNSQATMQLAVEF